MPGFRYTTWVAIAAWLGVIVPLPGHADPVAPHAPGYVAKDVVHPLDLAAEASVRENFVDLAHNAERFFLGHI